LAIASALTLVFAQHPFARSVFEYQQYRDFTGIVERNPYPTLLVARPGSHDYSRYLLVAEGKHGADSEVADFTGREVSLRGSLIYRDGRTMIEVVSGSLRAEDAAHASIPVVNLGSATVRGEIVDSKCYLGVMNPGRSKVHRDCAVRCISGGIPPALATTDGLYLLAGRDGRQLNRAVLSLVGETVEVSCTVERSGETLTLKADPANYRRVER